MIVKNNLYREMLTFYQISVLKLIKKTQIYMHTVMWSSCT